MLPSDRTWAWTELLARGLPAACDKPGGSADRGVPGRPPGHAHPRSRDLMAGLAEAGPGPGRRLPDAPGYLADRLARMPDAHPAAWPAADRSVNDHPASADSWRRGETDAWWRGETDAWWRGPDPSAADDDGIDEADGPGDSGDISDLDLPAAASDRPGAGDVADGDGRPHAGDAGGPGPGDSSRRASPLRRTAGEARKAGPTGPGYGQRDSYWTEPGGSRAGPAGPDHGQYRPWFTTGQGTDPWFAASPAQQPPVT